MGHENTTDDVDGVPLKIMGQQEMGIVVGLALDSGSLRPLQSAHDRDGGRNRLS